MKNKKTTNPVMTPEWMASLMKDDVVQKPEPPSYQPKSATDKTCTCVACVAGEVKDSLKEAVKDHPDFLNSSTVAKVRPEVLVREVELATGLVLKKDAAIAFAEIFDLILNKPPKDLYHAPVARDCCMGEQSTAPYERSTTSEKQLVMLECAVARARCGLEAALGELEESLDVIEELQGQQNG